MTSRSLLRGAVPWILAILIASCSSMDDGAEHRSDGASGKAAKDSAPKASGEGTHSEVLRDLVLVGESEFAVGLHLPKEIGTSLVIALTWARLRVMTWGFLEDWGLEGLRNRLLHHAHAKRTVTVNIESSPEGAFATLLVFEPNGGIQTLRASMHRFDGVWCMIIATPAVGLHNLYGFQRKLILGDEYEEPRAPPDVVYIPDPDMSLVMIPLNDTGNFVMLIDCEALYRALLVEQEKMTGTLEGDVLNPVEAK